MTEKLNKLQQSAHWFSLSHAMPKVLETHAMHGYMFNKSMSTKVT